MVEITCISQMNLMLTEEQQQAIFSVFLDVWSKEHVTPQPATDDERVELVYLYMVKAKVECIEEPVVYENQRYMTALLWVDEREVRFNIVTEHFYLAASELYSQRGQKHS
jgi:hypothetical protein